MKKMNLDLSKNYIFKGDCLTWLKFIPDQSIDLIYIDPPFFTNKDHKVVVDSETRSFSDKWKDINHYISFIRDRIKISKDKLKDTGSIFLHCDSKASHHLRLLLDELFGYKNFINEIIWCYKTSLKIPNNSFCRNHDNILFYSKTKFHKINHNRLDFPPSESTIKRWGKYADETGFVSNMYFSGGDSTIINTKDKKKGFNIKYGVPSDWWVNISIAKGKERLGYPTQKPEKLLKRIIECASNKNDIVLDFFAGSGTTAKVAFDLGRKFITGDVSPVACKIIKKRLDIVGKNDLLFKEV